MFFGQDENNFYTPLNDLEVIPDNISTNIIQDYLKKKKKYNINYGNFFDNNEPCFLYNVKDDYIEALMNIRHSKKPTFLLNDPPYSSRQCEGKFIRLLLKKENIDDIPAFIRYLGVNCSRSIDRYYSMYNKNSGNVSISVAFQLLLDFSLHFSPPESTLTFETNELIEYAKRGDCGALYRLGLLLSNKNSAEWNYPPALYEVGRLDNSRELIVKASNKDYHLAKAFLKYDNFQGTDEELVNKYINDYPNSDVTAEFYLYGIHLERDETKALSILKQNQNYFKLGMYYLFYKEIQLEEAYEAFKNGSMNANLDKLF